MEGVVAGLSMMRRAPPRDAEKDGGAGEEDEEDAEPWGGVLVRAAGDADDDGDEHGQEQGFDGETEDEAEDARAGLVDEGDVGGREACDAPAAEVGSLAQRWEVGLGVEVEALAQGVEACCVEDAHRGAERGGDDAEEDGHDADARDGGGEPAGVGEADGGGHGERQADGGGVHHQQASASACVEAVELKVDARRACGEGCKRRGSHRRSVRIGGAWRSPRDANG